MPQIKTVFKGRMNSCLWIATLLHLLLFYWMEFPNTYINPKPYNPIVLNLNAATNQVLAINSGSGFNHSHRAINPEDSILEKDYFSRWESYVQQRGNEQYPNKARERGITGKVKIKTTIGFNGKLLSLTMLKSSGSLTLDQSAINSVTKAAPFEPIPSEWIKDGVKTIEIVRIWHYLG